MKAIFLSAVAILASASTMTAQTVVKNLYDGEPVAVTWDNTLTIAAENFAEDVNVGDYIHITFSETTDVIELKANGTWLPGSRFFQLGDATTEMNTYITSAMLSTLKEYGLELCGASFTVAGVEICNDGFNMPSGAIWGGYFWVSEWNTLEIFKTAFDSYDGEPYMDIYLSDDNGDNDGYFMKVLTAWDNPDAIWADNDEITHTAKVATVNLEGIDVAKALEDVNTLMIQSNPEGGNPYNITAVALRGTSTDLSGITAVTEPSFVNVYTLQGILVKENVKTSEALEGLPGGLYIVGERKVMK